MDDDALRRVLEYGKYSFTVIRENQGIPGMNCDECRGACCETIIIPLSVHEDTDRWVILHGQRVGARVALNCKCTALTEGGRCSIYSDRPEICQAYPAGGADCLETVRAFRTPVEYARIRDDCDPVTLEAPPKLVTVV